MSQNTVIPQGANSHFARIPGTHIERSVFDRSHSYSTTFNENVLIPIYCDEVLPGDNFELNASILCRLATPKFPFMDNLQLDMHFFFVPNRLVWENWKKFMGERAPKDLNVKYTVPTFSLETVKYKDNLPNSIFDYFGLPIYSNGNGIDTTVSFNSLPLRAYNLIWNDWFRDENLQEPVDVLTGDIENGSYYLLPRNKRKDYFTSALPWPQKGDATVLPISSEVTGTPYTYAFEAVRNDSFKLYTTYNGTDYPVLCQYNSDFWPAEKGMLSPNQSHQGAKGGYPLKADLRFNQEIDPNKFKLKLTNNSGLTINDFRQAVAVQRFLELNARGGTRYVEMLLTHFGVVSSDARLQRPEFLGQCTFDLNVSPVVQNSATDETSPQGNLSAFAMAGGMQHAFEKGFEEHGYIIGLASIRSDLTYQQGLKRMWSRKDLYDFAFPQFAHLGEQAVLNKELFTQGTTADEEVFGYQERYAEYRYNQGQITGLLRSDAPQSLDVWHLAQDFSALPKLNSDFIKEQIPVDRVVAIPSQPHFILNTWFDLKCSRPLPTYSIPGLEVI